MLSTLDAVLQRDRAVVLLALAVMIISGWVYLLTGAGMDATMEHRVGGGSVSAWSAKHVALVLVMWMAMMAAMMLPSAAPMILLHRTVDGRRVSGDGAAFRTGMFVAGYLLVWIGFSVAATAVQWALDQWGLLSPAMAFESRPAGAALLLAAGLFQFSPLKQACLSQCRSPLNFLVHHWRNDPAGTLVMGVCHGLYCLGCCWALMVLLFAGGVMNMLWVVGLTLWVLLEKAAPQGRLLGHAAGIALITAALAMLVI